MLTFQDIFFFAPGAKTCPTGSWASEGTPERTENEKKKRRDLKFGVLVRPRRWRCLISWAPWEQDVLRCHWAKVEKIWKKWQFTSLLLLIFFIDTNAPVGQKQEEGTWLSDFMHEKRRLACLHKNSLQVPRAHHFDKGILFRHGTNRRNFTILTTRVTLEV